jgi:hypothetical protein
MINNKIDSQQTPPLKKKEKPKITPVIDPGKDPSTNIISISQVNVTYPFIIPTVSPTPEFFDSINCATPVILSPSLTHTSTPLTFIPSKFSPEEELSTYSSALNSLQPLISESDIFRKENSLMRIYDLPQQTFCKTDETHAASSYRITSARPMGVFKPAITNTLIESLAIQKSQIQPRGYTLRTTKQETSDHNIDSEPPLKKKNSKSFNPFVYKPTILENIHYILIHPSLSLSLLFLVPKK